MNTVRKIYDDMPDFIEIPKEIRHKKAEVIIIPIDDDMKSKNTLKQFFGSIPDFPALMV